MTARANRESDHANGGDASDGLSALGLGARVAERWLFDGLDLALTPGARLAIVGPNGAGKSTLLRCLAGLRACDHGHVALGGIPLDSLDPRDRARRLSYLPQATPLHHDLCVEDVVMLGRLPHLPRFGRPRRADRDAVDQALVRVELTALRRRLLSSLSGGERQRVMLARMLAGRAPVLLLDEPTTALDLGHAIAILEFCERLAEDGHAIAIAIHDLTLVRRFAGMAVCLTTHGSHRVGPAEDVLHPDVLGPVFGVELGLSQGQLIVHGRTSTSDALTCSRSRPPSRTVDTR